MCKANTDFFFLVCTPAHPFMYFRILFVHTHDRLDAAAAVGLNSVQGLISNTSIWTLIHMPHTVECISGAVANGAIEKPKRQWIDKNTTSLWRLFRFYRRMFSWTVSCPFIMSVCGVCIVHVCVWESEKACERMCLCSMEKEEIRRNHAYRVPPDSHNPPASADVRINIKSLRRL